MEKIGNHMINSDLKKPFSRFSKIYTAFSGTVTPCQTIDGNQPFIYQVEGFYPFKTKEASPLSDL